MPPVDREQKAVTERRTWRAMLTSAFLRWESAVTIALVVLLAFFLPKPFAGWQWWFWLVGGALAEAAIIYTSITDPEFGRQVVADMLRGEFSLDEVLDERYRGYLEKRWVPERIAEAIAQRGRGVLRDHFQETARQTDDWIQSIHEIACRLDQFRQNDLIRRDLEAVPVRLKNMRKQLEQEVDPGVRAQLEETLRAKEVQSANLQQLESNMQRAELQLEHTLRRWGRSLPTLLVSAKDVDSGRARRLREEVAEQVQGLQDVLDSMEEVYGTSSTQ
jgi:hypothetical protein